MTHGELYALMFVLSFLGQFLWGMIPSDKRGDLWKGINTTLLCLTIFSMFACVWIASGINLNVGLDRG